jgi:hypothetical protein
MSLDKLQVNYHAQSQDHPTHKSLFLAENLDGAVWRLASWMKSANFQLAESIWHNPAYSLVHVSIMHSSHCRQGCLGLKELVETGRLQCM